MSRMPRAPRNEAASFRVRAWFALGIVGLGAVGLAARAVELQLIDREFLIGRGEAAAVREVKIEAHRGAIVDRNGRPLAISTPVESLYADPREIANARDSWPQLAKQLKRNPQQFARTLEANQNKSFVWLARH